MNRFYSNVTVFPYLSLKIKEYACLAGYEVFEFFYDYGVVRCRKFFSVIEDDDGWFTVERHA